MFERYHVPLRTVESRAPPVPKFIIVRASNCANCGKCEKACIYGVHKRSEQDPRKMADPINQLCKNCFRCIDECPQRSLSMAPGPEYQSLGRGIWTPLRIATIWGEAETGKIPVYGAGYRGPFAGLGYDGMWTDMSEIVRPTRDGIHGREYISTSVDIGSKPDFLEFGKDGSLLTKLSPIIELPVPVVMDTTRLRSLSENMLRGFANASLRLQTLLIASPDSLPKDASERLNSHLVPAFPDRTDVNKLEIPGGVRMVELPLGRSWKEDAREFREKFPDVLLSFRVNAGKGIEQKVLDLVRAKIDVVHVLYDEEGNEEGSAEPRHAKDSLRAIHRAMVSKAVRDRITVIAGGGIAAAEHVPKAIICGADVVALEKALVIALECRDCLTCSVGSCSISLHSAHPDWVEGRVENMVGSWRDQLLEVLGAMGLREVRRLRGEVGRAIFYEDVEREAFSGIAGGVSDG
ncbi:MAG: glutamate synthase-related protein [Thermoplasmata archaeon]